MDRPAIELATIEGHSRGPALSWAELVTASAQPDDRLSPTQRLLLLLPAYGDADTPQEAIDVVSAALAAVGAREHVRDLTAELLDSPFLESPQWTLTAGALVCSGPYANRGLGTMAAEDLAVVSSVLSADDRR